MGQQKYPETTGNGGLFICWPAFSYFFGSFLTSLPATSNDFVSILNLYNDVGDQNSSINVCDIFLKWQYTYHRPCLQSYGEVQPAR